MTHASLADSACTIYELYMALAALTRPNHAARHLKKKRPRSNPVDIQVPLSTAEDGIRRFKKMQTRQNMMWNQRTGTRTAARPERGTVTWPASEHQSPCPECKSTDTTTHYAGYADATSTHKAETWGSKSDADRLRAYVACNACMCTWTEDN